MGKSGFSRSTCPSSAHFWQENWLLRPNLPPNIGLRCEIWSFFAHGHKQICGHLADIFPRGDPWKNFRIQDPKLRREKFQRASLKMVEISVRRLRLFLGLFFGPENARLNGKIIWPCLRWEQAGKKSKIGHFLGRIFPRGGPWKIVKNLSPAMAFGLYRV